MKRTILILLYTFISTSPCYSAQILDVDVIYNPDALPLNVGDVLHFKVKTDGKGEVTVDIGTVRQGIKLRDDGTNGDIARGDSIYELNYRILVGDTIEEGPVIAHFIAADGSKATYNGQAQGGRDRATPLLTIDATPPIITNDGVHPNPFNPNKQMAYVYYTLTERCNVSIEILSHDGSRGEAKERASPLRTLANPSSDFGENQAAWDGTDENARILEDAQYTYLIKAVDLAGNEATLTSGGIILSTAEMHILSSVVAPNPFSPDGDNVKDVTRISFEVSLLANGKQLSALGLGNENKQTATDSDDGIPSPYALIGITVSDSAGNVVHVIDHDLSRDSDRDFAPNGWPNDRAPVDVPLSSGNFLGEPGGLPDYGDGNKTNDWDTLVPLDEDIGTNTYKTNFGFVWGVQNLPDGIYLINITCELVSRTWLFTDYMLEGETIIGERWNAIPNRNYGITAPPIQKSVIIDRGNVIGADDDAPIVASSNPSNGTIIDISKKQISEISAVLDDGAGGSGVDLSNSTIALISPVGNFIKGAHKPFGLNTIKLVLDEPLHESGEYIISIVTVDKRGNKSKAIEHKFTIKDTTPPTVVPNTIIPAPNTPDNPYTKPVSEISVVLTDGLTGSGADLESSALLLKDSANTTIVGQMSFDDKSTRLTYTLAKPLKTNGAYSIVVIAADKAGAQAIYTYEFTLNLKDNIIVSFNEQDYALIYADTEIQKPLNLDPTQITVQVVSSQPHIFQELNQLGKAIRFQPSNVYFSQPIEIIMPYNPDELPSSVVASGSVPTSLKLYALSTDSGNGLNGLVDSGWHQIETVDVVAADSVPPENRLVGKVTRLDEYYVVAYLRPAEAVLAQKVKLSSKYFNPLRNESLAITLPNTASKYRVEVYNTAAELIRKLTSSNNSVTWDGRNEDGLIVNHGVYILRIRYTENGQVRLKHRLVAVVK